MVRVIGTETTHLARCADTNKRARTHATTVCGWLHLRSLLLRLVRAPSSLIGFQFSTHTARIRYGRTIALNATTARADCGRQRLRSTVADVAGCSHCSRNTNGDDVFILLYRRQHITHAQHTASWGGQVRAATVAGCLVALFVGIGSRERRRDARLARRRIQSIGSINERNADAATVDSRQYSSSSSIAVVVLGSVSTLNMCTRIGGVLIRA